MKGRIYSALASLAALALPSTARCENRYLQHNLVSDLPGLADHVDPNLVNPWGISASPTSPFWILNNGKGLANVYDTSGKPAALVVSVPTPSGAAPSKPTGQVFNNTTSFVLQGAKSAVFLFSTEEGTISGWYNGIDKNNAVIAVNNSGSGAVYKGLALGASDAGPMLYAANFRARTVDVFGGDFSPKTTAGAFVDPNLPAAFAPFNVYVAGGNLYVAYAKQDDEKEDDVPGEGNGYVDVFDTTGRLLRRLISGGRLNSPWGMVIAPENFGDFSKALLVGNFGDGTINAYNPNTGEFVGTLQDAAGKPIVNAGLWGLQFGNGAAGGDATTLYFTAGISGPAGEPIESHGLFGSIQAAPLISTGGILNAAGFQNGIAPNTWVSVFGKNLAATTRTWQPSDFNGNQLPTQLDGVSVTVDGKPAYISYISPTQVNFLTPSTLGNGDLAVQTKSNGLASNSAVVSVQAVSPALFRMDKYAVGTHADGKSLVGPLNLVPGSTTPAEPGEVIVFYGNGFGETDPPIPEGTVVTTPATTVRPTDVVIGGRSSEILFKGLSATGLYQINVKVPSGLPDGDTPIFVQMIGGRSPDGVFTAVKAPAPATPVDVMAQINNFQFMPDPVNVAQAGKLIWTNRQGVEHTVVSDTGQFQSGVLGQNEAFSFTFTAPGTYPYHCSIHPFMKGQVIVK